MVGMVSLLLWTLPAAASDDSAVVSISVDEQGLRRECAGAAVASKTILTSAHCLQGARRSAITVAFGAHTTAVTEVILHPQFDGTRRLPHFDMALVRTAGTVTTQPLPVVVSSGLGAGEKFSMLRPPAARRRESEHARSAEEAMVVADLERAILRYIKVRRGTFPDEAIVAEVERRIKQGDAHMRQKIIDDFGGFIVSLYSESGAAIRRGDSGSPAIVSRSGHPSVIGVATAVAGLEPGSGSTSIFTSFSHTESLAFLRQFAPEITFE